MTRKYDSPKRQEAKQTTRDRILDAVVEVVTREGVHAFTVQNVANAAGVAHRTVYRHFASREDLLDGLDDLLERRGKELGMSGPMPGLDVLAERIEPMYRGFDAFRDAMGAYVVISVALGRTVPGFAARTKAIRKHLSRAFPGLSREELRASAAMIHHLCGSRSWYLLTTEHGLSTSSASKAVARTVEAILADLGTRATS